MTSCKKDLDLACWPEAASGAAVGLRGFGGQEHAQSSGAHAEAPRREVSQDHRDGSRVDELLVELFLWRRMTARRARSCSTLDNTDIPLHGGQGVSFFHGYYDEFATCRSTCSAAGTRCWPGSGSRRRRQRWRGRGDGTHHRPDPPEVATVRIILRGDSGFAVDPLMRWCEANRVDYVRPRAQFPPGSSARQPSCRGEATVYSVGPVRPGSGDFRYRTLDSWSRERRVVGKAEHTLDGANRFVVTRSDTPVSPILAPSTRAYCARGEAENWHRRTVRTVRRSRLFRHHGANQLRMWFSAMAYVLVDTLRRVGLRYSSSPMPGRPFVSGSSLGAQVRTSR